MRAAGVVLRVITPAVALLATQFPPDFPADPADRLIAPTASVEAVTVVTRDERVRSAPLLRTVW